MFSIIFVVAIVSDFYKGIWIMESPGLCPASRAGREGGTKSSKYKSADDFPVRPNFQSVLCFTSRMGSQDWVGNGVL